MSRLIYRTHWLDMKILMQRFPHLAEQILQKLDNEGMAKSREVQQVWQTFIDERDYSWLRIVDIPTVLPKEKTYFHLAAEHGQIDAFKMILNEDNNADPKDDWGETPYLMACLKGHINIASMLMKKSRELKIDLNRSNNGGLSAFHLSCQEGNSNVAKMIMNNSSKLKIDLNIKDTGGETAFHLACSGGHSQIAEIMINNFSKLKMNLSTTNNNDSTAFHLACFKGHFKIAKMILENSPKLKINLNQKNKEWGQTAFHLACSEGHSDIAEIIINNFVKLKIDLSATDNTDSTAFHLACSEGHLEIAKMILENSSRMKIDLNRKNKTWCAQGGYTAFQLVCLRGYSKIAEIIINKSLELNIDLNPMCDDGMTVFHLACVGPQLGNLRIVEMILEQAECHKIDLTAIERMGMNGYQIAEYYKNTDVINLIKTNMPGLVKLPFYKCSSCDSISFAKKSKLTDHIVSVHEGK